ncbi:MAG: mannose-1-phosphate guanylyltransferase [Candidatus Moranbacteria bacterium]|nr:mannose-1-phosphate guanylyltransferase [Candidatus Moranbacteria bacterium]
MYSVILCGGSGTRLWPMSRKNLPKQFLKLYGDQSLLQETYVRVRELLPIEHVFFVTNKENAQHVLEQIQESEKEFPENQVIIEPAARNTAPAIALAMKYLVEKVRIDEAEPVLFLPSDHYIGGKNAYLETVKKVLDIGEDCIGTIGIVPTKAETGYGYIRKGEKRPDGSFSILEFKEKPDKATAEKYIASGEYLWNSGMYFFNARTFFAELSLHAPEIAHFFEDGFEMLLTKYVSVPAVSIDYAISEKSQRGVVFAGEFGWSDIGSFDSLADIIGNNPAARHIGIDSKNVYTYSTENRLIATIGVEDLIVVETKGSILICKRGHAEDVRKVVEKLKESEPGEL